MLIGCAVGGILTGVLGWGSGGVKTGVFAFTSLLTIPVFSPMWVYVISIAAAFGTAMALIIISDYRTPEQKAEARAAREQAEADLALESAGTSAAPVAAAASVGGGTATLVATDVVAAPVAGTLVQLADVNDKVFASKALGEGVGIVPANGTITSPVSGVVVTAADTGHAFGIKTDDGVEVLVHVGIDTVRLSGQGFTVSVVKDQRVNAGDRLVEVDLAEVEKAGFDPTTIVTVTNTFALASVTPRTSATVAAGEPVIDVRV